MSRAPAGSFADFFPNAPSVSQHKRKRDSHDRSQSGIPHSKKAHSSDSASKDTSSSSAQDAKAVTRNTTTEVKGQGNNTSLEEEHESHRGDSGDLLNDVGSASSLASTVSSVFSNQQHPMSSYAGATPNPHTLTPLTNAESSPPGKAPSPRTHKSHHASSRVDVASSFDAPAAARTQDISETITPVHTPPEAIKQVLPGPGQSKGKKCMFDPESLPRDQRKGRKPVYKSFGESDLAPPPDPRLAIAGYTTGSYNLRASTKSKLRVAPYNIGPYKHDPRISIGPPPARQVLVTGFDPLTASQQIRAVFSSYGEVERFDFKTNPANGANLGICLIRYRDTPPARGRVQIKASVAAKTAEKQGNQERIQGKEIQVQLDREGRRCQRAVEVAVNRNRRKEEPKVAPEPSKATKSAPPIDGPPVPLSAPPPDAPKGPSGRGGMRPPEAPRATILKHAAHALVETEPILSKIKRKPYIFIAHCYVPVLGTTIPHLRKRLKMYTWEDVRVDRTGYYVIFEDSKRGEDEAVRCHKECHMTPLFTYVMNMEVEPYGNPNYERSPSPERVAEEKRAKAERERLQKEEEMDLENEKKQRAGNLDPVIAAIEQVRVELRDKIMSDIKQRIAAPALFDYLDPERHVAKRRKLNIPDPKDASQQRPQLQFGRGDMTPPVGTPNSRSGFPGGRRPLSAYEPNAARGRKGRRDPRPVNAFIDERRRRPPPKKTVARPLHRQMMGFYGEEDDSDDEMKSSFTRDTEEQESRPISRMSSVEPEEAEAAPTPQKKRRRKNETGWAQEVDSFTDGWAKRLLGDVYDKEIEEMADGELDMFLSVMPKTSPLWKRARQQKKLLAQWREDDELFGVKAEEPEVESHVESQPGSVLPSIDITLDQDSQAVETPEPEEALAKAATKKKPKPKRKTKKQIAEEREVLKAQAKAAAEATGQDEDVVMTDLQAEAEKAAEEALVEEPRAEVEWGVSTEAPEATVYDDPELLMDIDGWQTLVKDDEDLEFARKVLESERTAKIGDVKLWSWKQKEIKALNNGGVQGAVRDAPRIEGYYVPNLTGCARTEPIKKILESEKSKYLPHRIRVQKAREEREAKAKNDPQAALEAAKLATTIKVPKTTANARSNRANNRRLANDIIVQKQSLSSEGDAMRFNQLKKRKKLVKFDRSAIHNWGLYAEEDIAANDMIIEYVGEKVRQRVAEMREDRYDKQGVGSSYLFRIDDEDVIDATKKGGIARFINHSCMPNCTAKIIRVDGTKRIVIYAARDIAKHEELTYDYKFEREKDKDSNMRVPCLCGSVNCKGFLN